MIKIKVELHPYGDRLYATEIAEMTIMSTGGDETNGEYEASLHDDLVLTRPRSMKGIEHFRDDTVWKLVYRALLEFQLSGNLDLETLRRIPVAKEIVE